MRDRGHMLFPPLVQKFAKVRYLAHNLDPVVDLPYIPPVEFHPPINFEYDAVLQVAPTMEPTPSSSFVPQPAPQHGFATVNYSLPSIPRSTRSFSKRNVSAVLHDLDDNADGQSDAEETDDEYVPSSSRNPKKRRCSTRNTNAPAYALSNAAPQYASPSAKRSRPAPPPRNTRAIPGTNLSSASKSNPWACPYCKWVQRNHRTPDLKRHIRTHTRFERPAQWVCCANRLQSTTFRTARLHTFITENK
ncbi:uncharacterized protein EDB91DRAFT_1335859 [Suillus paluster]|uniref:uncharacterized protein n=1 Tax=Suillus paluster TaxID=48578 RepID=UPI001B886211|nr:uncharacterized protein EDB91DRAFT_1335859 [Suillus paluster]KAG1743207.1 hypothetical protein EDB91DRAFT_1335859 [Suillus paluster]